VATWKELNTLPAKPAGKQYADARRELQARRSANAREALVRILTPALDRLDPKPFETFIKAIALAKDLNLSGAILRDAHEVLRVAFEMGLELGDNVIQTVSPKDFKARLRWRIAERQFARIKKQIGLHFTSGRPKA
jgi:hypothetical protein